MTDNRPSHLAPSDRELRLWKLGRALAVIFAAAILVAGGVFFGLVLLLDFQEVDTTAKLDAKTLFDLVKLSFGVVAGAGALVALVVAYRRQRVDESGAHRDVTRLHTERFTKAVEQLGSDSPAIQLGGVHALAGLADDAPDQGLRQTCIDVLCAYLQLPYTPDPGSDPAHQEEHHRYLALRKVRHTILRLIAEHYRRPQGTHGSWQGYDLDLTDVTIDGAMNFSGATFSGGTVSFGGATFSDGMVSFGGATFSGGTVSFGGATFSGGRVHFGDAVFAGGEVLFGKSTFSGGTVEFGDAVFAGSEVRFDWATFSGGDVDFGDADFSGSNVSFREVTFSGGTVDFAGSRFSGGYIDFNFSTVSGAALLFNRASFSDGVVFFRHVTFSGGLTNFEATTFSGCDVRFNDVIFAGGAVTFSGAAGPVPRGLLEAVGFPIPETVLLSAPWIPES
ncbi:hypothetical protein C1708_33090 [Streptomyces sp. DH-12]|uniref:pentapeptide repeat-containing protein n=1 Tax=Streptomyces sp. DH-12 TaxID=2072509 RepID=UPI000CCF6C86|nr:pentapeptide repeat-containing protein [Streptomyces sp. DH-12]PNV30914.1 hypothetical protein C1708_33090 [Streptomyces sp. DH-12]